MIEHNGQQGKTENPYPFFYNFPPEVHCREQDDKHYRHIIHFQPYIAAARRMINCPSGPADEQDYKENYKDREFLITELRFNGKIDKNQQKDQVADCAPGLNRQARHIRFPVNRPLVIRFNFYPA
jgi:hypothetical protein